MGVLSFIWEKTHSLIQMNTPRRNLNTPEAHLNTPFGHLNTPECRLNTPWGSKVNTP